jgi:dihydroxyacetone kinase-like protein
MSKAKRFINDPKLIGHEITAGLISASAELLHKAGNENVLITNDLAVGKVGVVTGGGGSLFARFIGKNMADCVPVGNIEAAPSPIYILEGIRASDQGKGVLLVYNNHSGDVLSFDMAAELAEEEGIKTKTIRVRDSIGPEPPEKNNERSGIVGIILVLKIAGGAASEIDDLEEVYRITSSARDNLRSILVVANSFSKIENGELMFRVPEDEMIIGSGGHGEPGIIQCKMMSANDTVDFALDKLLGDLHLGSGDEVGLLINSMGATSWEELFIINNRIKDVLSSKSINIHHTDIGYFFPYQDMVGFTISIMRLNDELKRFYDLPANSFGYKR